MKHAQRERTLGTGDLVLVKLPRIGGSVAEFIVLRVGSGDSGEEHSARVPLGARFHFGFDLLQFQRRDRIRAGA